MFASYSHFDQAVLPMRRLIDDRTLAQWFITSIQLHQIKAFHVWIIWHSLLNCARLDVMDGTLLLRGHWILWAIHFVDLMRHIVLRRSLCSTRFSIDRKLWARKTLLFTRIVSRAWWSVLIWPTRDDVLAFVVLRRGEIRSHAFTWLVYKWVDLLLLLWRQVRHLDWELLLLFLLFIFFDDLIIRAVNVTKAEAHAQTSSDVVWILVASFCVLNNLADLHVRLSMEEHLWIVALDLLLTIEERTIKISLSSILGRHAFIYLQSICASSSKFLMR